MKKYISVAISLLAMLAVACEKDNGEKELSGDDVIEFKDPNFLKALLMVRDFSIKGEGLGEYINYTMDVDENKDGKITVNEAQKVRALFLGGYENSDGEWILFNIQEMPEIKYFTAITDLLCHDNSLSSLDLSRNTALENLYCNDNFLSSLDLSNNTALKYLFCPRNPYLTDINVNGCTVLEELHCNNCFIKSLDVSTNTSMTHLNCESNDLTMLDLSNNTALENFRCSSNQKLEKVILPKEHSLSDFFIRRIINEYGEGIIEYR